MKIDCCNITQDSNGKDYALSFQVFTIRKKNLKAALKRLYLFDNAHRKQQGKLKRDFSYYTQRSGKTFDSLTIYDFICVRCSNRRLTVEYRQKTKKRPVAVFTFTGVHADIFQSATEDFWVKQREYNKGPQVYVCKHPSTFPIATSPETQAEHWLPTSLGFKDNKATVHEYEPVILKA